MVKELQAPKPESDDIPWEEQTLYYYELAVEGIPLPEKMEKLLEDRLHTFVGERSSEMARADREWEAYALWRAAHPEAEELTPGRRLTACFGSK